MTSGTNHETADFIAALRYAKELAQESKSEYLMLDHMLYGILLSPTIRHMVIESESEATYNDLLRELSEYLFTNEHITRNDPNAPNSSVAVRTSRYNEVIDRAVTLALLYNRPVDVIDLAYIMLTDSSIKLSSAGIIRSFIDTTELKEKVADALQSLCFQSYGDMMSGGLDGLNSQGIKVYRLEDLINPQSNGLPSYTDNSSLFAQDTYGTSPMFGRNLPAEGDQFKSNNKKTKEALQVLSQFCVDMNERVKNKKITQIIGRENETREVLQALGRKQKRNVVLTGDAGTGKSAIVDGLAYRIVNQQVPEKLKDLHVFSLDVSSVIAGTKYRGEFEERIKAIVQALEILENSVLFIDEIHTIKGTGTGSDGTLDFANLLKPALARGTLRVIGATTDEEYRKFFEKDKAIIRRFARVDVKEPTPEEAKLIVGGTIDVFENYHGVKYEEGVAEAAVDLAVRYIQNRALPDKVFDIIDSVASTKKLYGTDNVVTLEDIEAEVSKMTKVPVSSKKDDEFKKYKTLAEDIKKKIYGQDHVVDNVTKKLLVSVAGLRESTKTKLAALLTGTTGTGKTELCKQLALQLGVDFIRFDMSEFQEKHTVSKLIGSPPGYKGYDDGAAGAGALITAVEKSPNCVLLFDEVEKAHPDVINILLQVMDYGTLTSSNGKKVSFRNVIMFLTSNVGAQEMEKTPIGFGQSDTQQDNTAQINQFFAPEFRNRLDIIVTFNQLGAEFMEKVVDKFVGELNQQLHDKNITVVLDDSAKKEIVQLAMKKKLGARPVAGLITEHIKEPLGEKMVYEDMLLDNTVAVTINVKYEDKFQLEVK